MDAAERARAFSDKYGLFEYDDALPDLIRQAEQAARREAQAERDVVRAEKDIAYLERNQVVAALAKLFPSGVKQTDIPGWNKEWHGCVYIDLPSGQVSWHFHNSQAHLFADLPPYKGEWDGHTTPEKYDRLATLSPGAARQDERRRVMQLLVDYGYGKPVTMDLLKVIGALAEEVTGE